MITQTYAVEGMTCGHCAASVQREVRGLPGIADARVDVAAGTLTVVAASEPRDEAIAAAVDEAGYTVTGRR